MNQPTVPGRKFYVIVAGKTNGAHQQIVDDVKTCGQIDVDRGEDSDYLLVFCPIASRTETDINEALSRTPAGKSIILVVMHHTFDSRHIVAESRRQVNNPNVILTVDYLFYDGKLTHSNRNEISLHEIKKILGVPLYQNTSIIEGVKRHRWAIAISAGILSVAIVTVTFCVLYFRT